MSRDLATKLIVGKTMHKFDKQGSTYLFLIILLKYVAADAFGIWNWRNTGKSVTNWVTHAIIHATLILIFVSF